MNSTDCDSGTKAAPKAKKKPKKAPAQAWGLLAVPLGNAGNRRRFNDWFRWDRDGMYQHLTRLAPSKPPMQDWTDAKKRFTDALADERKLAAERTAAYRACFDPVDDDRVFRLVRR